MKLRSIIESFVVGILLCAIAILMSLPISASSTSLTNNLSYLLVLSMNLNALNYMWYSTAKSSPKSKAFMDYLKIVLLISLTYLPLLAFALRIVKTDSSLMFLVILYLAAALLSCFMAYYHNRKLFRLINPIVMLTSFVLLYLFSELQFHIIMLISIIVVDIMYIAKIIIERLKSDKQTIADIEIIPNESE